MVKFSLFISLGSSEIPKIKINYPDMGSICYRDIFNCIIQSRIPQISVKDIQISLPYEGALRSFTFQHNHYVPLFFILGKILFLKKKVSIWIRKVVKSKKSSFKFPGYSVNATVLLFPKFCEKIYQKLINFSGNQSSVLKNK